MFQLDILAGLWAHSLIRTHCSHLFHYVNWSFINAIQWNNFLISCITTYYGDGESKYKLFIKFIRRFVQINFSLPVKGVAWWQIEVSVKQFIEIFWLFIISCVTQHIMVMENQITNFFIKFIRLFVQVNFLLPVQNEKKLEGVAWHSSFRLFKKLTMTQFIKTRSVNGILFLLMRNNYISCILQLLLLHCFQLWKKTPWI